MAQNLEVPTCSAGSLRLTSSIMTRQRSMLPLLAACSNRASSAPYFLDTIKSLICRKGVIEMIAPKKSAHMWASVAPSRALMSQGSLGAVVRHASETEENTKCCLRYNHLVQPKRTTAHHHANQKSTNYEVAGSVIV